MAANKRFDKLIPIMTSTIIFQVPNDLALLYKNLVNGTGESIISLFSDIHRDLKEKHEKSEVMIKGLEDIKLLFELAKRAYDKKTLNYEIYQEIESQLYKLINKLKESNFEEANNISNELMEVLKVLINTQKMIYATSANVLIVEDTGQKLGDMRIFKTKRD